MDEAKETPFRVLSIDGGGIRGLIPAMVLAEIERRLPAEKPLHRCFDLIVGTSAGAIIAAGLAGRSATDRTRSIATADDLVALFRDHGAEIFPPTRTWPGEMLRRLRSTFGSSTYDPTPFEALLLRHFGDVRLGDTLTGLIVTAYDLQGCAARFFDDGDLGTRDLFLRDLVRASTAAPTYFPPARLTIGGEQPQTLTCVDGGVFAGDPALAAHIEAMKRVTLPGSPTRRIEIVSLGTGVKTVPHDWREVNGWSTLGWLLGSPEKPLIAAFMQGQASTSSYQLNKVLNDPGVRVAVPWGSFGAAPFPRTADMVLGPVAAADLRYIRIDGALGPDTAAALDVADGTNIERLVDDARRILDRSEDLVATIVGRL